jgi:hypothetical protein
MAILLGKLLEAGTSPDSKALLQEAVHSPHLVFEGRKQVSQEGLEPWRCGSLAADIVHAINPCVCDVPKEENGGIRMSWAHYF